MSRLGSTVGGWGGYYPQWGDSAEQADVWGPETGTELDHSPGGVLARQHQHPHYSEQNPGNIALHLIQP